MLINLRDAFRGQSRSPNLSYIGILSSCAIVILSLRRAVFLIFEFTKCRHLENHVRGPSRSLEMSPCDRAHTTSYCHSLVTMALSRVVSEIFNVEKCHVTLKSGSKVTQGH